MVGRVVTAVAIAALAVPATARAAPTVVLTAPGGASLAARDDPDAAAAAQRAPVAVDRLGYGGPDVFCLRVSAPDSAGHCDQQELPTLDDPVAYTETGTWFGGAVPAAAATVELVPPDGAPVRTPALAGDYHGVFAGRVKFFLTELTEEPRQVRAYDAAGTLIGDYFYPLAHYIGHNVGLARGRLAGGGRWTAGVRAEDVGAPGAGAPDRRVRADCLKVWLVPHHGIGTAILTCRDEARAAAGLLDLFPDCSTGRTALAALLPPGVRRAVVTLGSGRRLVLPGRPLPARFGARQYAVAAVVPRGAAIRSLSAGGRVRRLAVAPTLDACIPAPPAPVGGSGLPGQFAASDNDLFPPPQTPVPGAQPIAGGDLFAALRGDDVCAGLGGLPRSPDGCAPAPVRARETRFAGHGRELGLVTAPTVSAVQLVDAATRQTLAAAQTVPVGAGRAALLDAPPGRRLLVARMLGPDGLPLADIGLAPVALGPHRVMARGHGWVATATRIAVPQAFTDRGIVPVETTCVQVARQVPDGLDDDCLDDTTGLVRVLATCAPRLLHIFGAGRPPVLFLADGRRLVPHARQGAWHAVLGAHEALRAFRADGRRTPFAVPPAAAQCGYRGVRVS